jgi:hypothetical protein
MRRTFLPELQASDRVGAVLLKDIYCMLGCTIESDALSTLAEQPEELTAFWTAIRPAIQHSIVRSAADEVRRTADNFARQRPLLPDHLSWLAEHGHSREDARQIRYVVEAFYNLEPLFAMLAASAAKWAVSDSVGPWMVPRTPDHARTPAWFTGAVNLAARAAAPIGAVPADHPLARALAIWPDYMDKALHDLEAAASRTGMVEAATMLHSIVDLLTGHIPLMSDGCVAQGTALAEQMKSCLSASLEATVVACMLRRGFIRSETAARNRRIASTAP